MPYRRFAARNVTPTRTAAQAVTMKLDALVSRSLA